MRSFRSPITLLVAALCAILPISSAEQLLQTSSLTTCQSNSSFSATLFDVTFTPANNSLAFDIVGVSTITGNVTIELVILAYGLSAYKTTLNPCDEGLQGMCPMSAGQININSNVLLPASAIKEVPSIAYTVPDLDADVQIYINSTSTGQSLACIEAELSNGKTVYIPAVCWVIAVITGIGLIASAVASGMGHSNTAAHVAANTLALFGFFQAQAFIGMSSVHLPPIVQSWTQDFQWSMGIIRVGFIENICTWYQRSTGGTPSTVLSDLSTTSVEVEKRSLEFVYRMVKRSALDLHKTLVGRATTTASADTVVIVRGINRVGFRAKIEETNIFLTGYIFFLIFVVAVVLAVLIFKLIVEGLAKAGRMKGEKFIDFRNGWTTVLKGILFRVALISFPQMAVLCFWELTTRDSGAEVVLAIFTIFTLIAILAWASSKVIRLARRSINMHKNPAYILYSDPVTLNKWGFLYVSYKATAYYWIVLALIYILLKGMFIGLGQGSPITQAIAFVIIDGVYFITVCVLTPFMDKKTNAFNISIMVVNFLNAIFLLIFTGIFGQPGIVTGVCGVIFFVLNAVFALVLLIMLIVASAFALFSKNPDTRYQPMRDDRGSFIKSQTQLPHELDALGATARGEGRNGTAYKGARIEDDDDSLSGSSGTRVGGNSSSMAGRYADQPMPTSPVNGSFSSYPGGNQEARYNQPSTYHNEKTGFSDNISRTTSPQPPRYQPQQTDRASPWQRGAGYE